MDILVVPILLAALSLAGMAAAIVKASAPEAPVRRSVELSVLAVLLALTTLFLAFVAYFLWDFARGFTF